MEQDKNEYWIGDTVSEVPCAGCGGPVVEFSVPSDVWNRVVRRGGPETDKEYLCLICFHKAVAAYVRSPRRFQLFGRRGTIEHVTTAPPAPPPPPPPKLIEEGWKMNPLHSPSLPRLGLIGEKEPS